MEIKKTIDKRKKFYDKKMKAPVKEQDEIWKEDEIKQFPLDKHEMRKRPEFDVMYKQSVRPEDMFLGMSGLDPSTAKCQALLMKIQLPDTKLKEITLDV